MKLSRVEGWLRLAFWVLGLVLAATYVWRGRHVMWPDGIAYLDLADAFARKDWHMAVNTLWSPLYPLVLAMGFGLLRPQPIDQFAAVQVTNFFIYVGALVSFDFFLRQVVHYHRTYSLAAEKANRVALPAWALVVLAYPVFIWSLLHLISVTSTSPDILLAAFVYLTAGLFLMVRREPHNRLWVLLGAVAGVGYWAKAPMLPLALLFLGANALWAARAFGLRRGLILASLSLGAFALTASALVGAFLVTKGRVTLGDGATLEYAWHINGLPYTHWQGEPAGSGVPKHPTRRILKDPAIYEFAVPVRGTYPPWSDPAYWYEGVLRRFDAREHMSAFVRNARLVFRLVFMRPNAGLMMGAILLLYMGARSPLAIRNAPASAEMLLIAVAAFAMYSLIYLETRFIAPFVPLFWLGLFSTITVPRVPELKRAAEGTAILMSLMLLGPLIVGAFRDLPGDSSGVAGAGSAAQRQVAGSLKRLGIREGDRVAFIGYALWESWPRLAQVRVIAEVPALSGSRFWQAPAAVKRRVIETLVATGARAIVAADGNVAADGWLRLEGTTYLVCCVKNATGPPPWGK